MAKLPKDIQILYKKLFKDKEIPSVKVGSKQMKLGYLVNFVYDPKWKDVLPYYDTLPTSIVLARQGDRFIGINLHYVPWARRIQLAEQILRRTKNKNRITYKDILSAWKSAKIPLAFAYLSIRTYLYSHVRSEMKILDWETYREVIKDIRPKFRKQSETFILRHTMEKFKKAKEAKKQNK